ncbi:MAG: transcription antitermination factor NusB [Chloroflexi bacterium]|nr:transcription antitermination factor NusB [Chloroflexota bacterium]
MKIRHRARGIALKTLYEVDLARHPAESVLTRHLAEDPLPEEAAEYARLLVNGVLDNQEHLDEIIASIAPDWPTSQLAAIDRNILRLAIFELQMLPATPPKVTVNEAVELAKEFGSDGSRRFVNGALGTLLAKPQLLSA